MRHGYGVNIQQLAKTARAQSKHQIQELAGTTHNVAAEQSVAGGGQKRRPPNSWRAAKKFIAPATRMTQYATNAGKGQKKAPPSRQHNQQAWKEGRHKNGTHGNPPWHTRARYKFLATHGTGCREPSTVTTAGQKQQQPTASRTCNLCGNRIQGRGGAGPGRTKMRWWQTKNNKMRPKRPQNLVRPSCKRDERWRNYAPKTQVPELAVNYHLMSHLMWLLARCRQIFREVEQASERVMSQRTL